MRDSRPRRGRRGENAPFPRSSPDGFFHSPFVALIPFFAPCVVSIRHFPRPSLYPMTSLLVSLTFAGELRDRNGLTATKIEA